MRGGGRARERDGWKEGGKPNSSPIFSAPGPVITFIGNQFFVREGESVELCVQLESGNVPFEFRVVAAINYSPVITSKSLEVTLR